LEFLGLWEKINNPNFKGLEFDPLLSEAGKNSFTMSPTRWVNDYNAIGIRTKATKNGGTFAHRDIALEFAISISPEVKFRLLVGPPIEILDNQFFVYIYRGCLF